MAVVNFFFEKKHEWSRLKDELKNGTISGRVK
jgi:hypothetical protein